MIQAPNAQYIPAQQPMQPCYPQPGAINPVQYTQPQTPGVIYNYPTTSCYTPAQSYSTDRAQYNGVNIEIINPQGQAGYPQAAMPSTYIPAQNLIPAQFIPPQQPVMQPIPYAPAPQTIMPQPAAQPMPYSVAPQQPVMPQPTVPAPQVITPAPQEAPATQIPAAPVVDTPATPNSAITPETFAGKLKTDNADEQKAVLENIAEIVKQDEVSGPILLDTQIFDALVDIINRDTSKLEGPSPEVIELRQKPKEELTAEEAEKAKTPAPLEKAEINKKYALYTIAYMQERLNNELVKHNGKALDLKDLPCIENVIDAAKSNQNPMIRISAIASLANIARPEYMQDLTTIFELAKSDEDENVRAAAEKAIAKINGASEN